MSYKPLRNRYRNEKTLRWLALAIMIRTYSWKYAKVYGLVFYTNPDVQRFGINRYNNFKVKRAYGSKFIQSKRQRRDRLIRRDGPGCVMCKRNYVQLTIDHVIPVSRGGHSGVTNLQLLCYECHREKDKDNNRGQAKNTRTFEAFEKREKAYIGRLKKEGVGALQAFDKEPLRKQMLYLSLTRPSWVQLAHWALYSFGQLWCLPAPRPAELTPTVFQLQHQPRG